MPDHPRCECCQFWDPDRTKEGWGFCRRFPPAVHYSEYYRKPESDIPRKLSMEPDTASNYWCGEFQPREQEADANATPPPQHDRITNWLVAPDRYQAAVWYRDELRLFYERSSGTPIVLDFPEISKAFLAGVEWVRNKTAP